MTYAENTPEPSGLVPARPSADERLSRVKCVLFDLDGTLIDTIELILESFRYATTKVLGRELPRDELLRNVGQPLATQMREFSPAHADELLRVYREYNWANHDSMADEYPGTERALEELRERGFALGVVTSKGEPMTRRGLELFDLGRYFDCVVTADDVPNHKPDPYPLRHAAGIIGVDVSLCAYVGDSPHDMAAALAADAVAIGVTWGAFTAAAVSEPGPDYIVDSMEELVALLPRRAVGEGDEGGSRADRVPEAPSRPHNAEVGVECSGALAERSRP